MSLGMASGDADVDEARVSSVARSADWVKLEYENQKPVQTLVGGIVPAGSDFSVSPNSVTMNENSSATLTAQAGGAQKVYWIYKKNGQETLLATDQLTLNYSPGRITGNDSAIIQFKAVFPGSTEMIDVPLTVTDTIPDPVFTLVPSTTSWDGRTTMTVTANITNLAAMQSAGFGTLNYKWNVSGVAVTKQENNGTLTLTRSQGSGPMTVALTLDNGGTPVGRSTTINVQEPASDPWLERVPGATEKPVNKQFFARNPETNMGTILLQRHPEPARRMRFSSKSIKPPREDRKRFTPPTAKRSSAVPMPSPLLFPPGSSPIASSMAPALIPTSPPSPTSSAATPSSSRANPTPWPPTTPRPMTAPPPTRGSAPTDLPPAGAMRSAKATTSSSASGDGISRTASSPTTACRSASSTARSAAPASTNTAQTPPATAPLAVSYSIYANLYNRVIGAKLTHGIRGLFWHQGEQNQGSGGIDPDYDYKFYQQYFVDMSAAWKQDFPNLRNYYLFQIWPAACGDQSRNDQLREVQRTLPRLYSNMKIMSTHGIVPGSSCHYEPAGYQKFSDLIGPLVEQDVYGISPSTALTAPNLKQAYFTTPAKNEIALVFDQNVAWNPGAPTMLFLANAAGAASGSVTGGSASGNTIKLQVSGASSAAAITYLKGLVTWNQANLLYGTNGIAALTFADVAIGALTPYQSWVADPAQGLTAGVNDGPLMDPDFDGVENVLEFVLRTAPMTSSTTALPAIRKDGGQWIFEYDRNDDSLPPATTQVVQYGDDLSGWTDILIPATSAGAVTITPGAPSDHVRVVIPDFGGNVFARLKASQ